MDRKTTEHVYAGGKEIRRIENVTSGKNSKVLGRGEEQHTGCMS